MIDNPEYKGEWAPRKIANPVYFEDLTPVKSLVPIVRHVVAFLGFGHLLTSLQGGVGIELWTMTEDILFDNIYIGHSVDDAKALAAETYEVKKPLEAEQAKANTKLDDDDQEEDVASFKEDPVAFLRSKVLTFIDAAKVDPLEALKSHPETGAGLLLAVITFFGMFGTLLGLIGGQQKPITKVRVCNVIVNG